MSLEKTTTRQICGKFSAVTHGEVSLNVAETFAKRKAVQVRKQFNYESIAVFFSTCLSGVV